MRKSTAVIGAVVLVGSLTIASGSAAASNCTVVGTAGDDTLMGTAGDDVICAGAGDDTIYGLEGNDVVYGGPGDDTIDGGPGTDKLWGGDGDDHIIVGEVTETDSNVAGGGPGDDHVEGAAGSDRLYTGPGTDFLHGHDGDDVLIGDKESTNVDAEPRNVMNGGFGDDRFYSGGGRTFMRDPAGTNLMYGSPYDDQFFTMDEVRGASINRIYAGAGDDYFWLGTSENHEPQVVFGGPGNDWASTLSNNSTFYGGEGDDLLLLDPEEFSNIRAWGGPGDDYLHATIVGGGPGNDDLAGDIVYAQDGEADVITKSNVCHVDPVDDIRGFGQDGGCLETR